MSSYKLYYFNGRGRAEPIRIIFAQAGVKYEDIRFDREQWNKEYKESKMRFVNCQLKIMCFYCKDMPFGLAPVLEVDGTKIGGAVNILRYLGIKFGKHLTSGFYLLPLFSAANQASKLVSP